MNVLHFYKTYFPETVGGVEQVIDQLATSTGKLGVQSKVMALSKEIVGKQPIAMNGYMVHQCRRQFEIASTPFSVSALAMFKQLAREADIIHYHFPYPFADLLHFASGIKKPSIVSYHSDIVKQKWLLKLYTPLQKRFLNKVNYIVAASPNYAKSSGVLNHFKDKVKVIPYGLDRESYSSACQNMCDKWRKRIGDKFFLFVGVTRYYKGLHVLLNAAQGSTYPIVILGSGPEEVSLKQQAQALQLNNVHFLGFLSEEDKIALLSQCYAFVFPSHLRSEAFGISLLEGAMFGKPMISCEIGSGTSFINQHNQTGLVIEPNVSSALRTAMDTLWHDEPTAKAMGLAAKQRYLSDFQAAQMARNYHDVYLKVLS